MPSRPSPTTRLLLGAAVLTSSVSRLWPGVALAALVSMAATFISKVHGGPQLLYALLFGVAMHHLSVDPRSRPGIEFCARAVMRFGVGLLGARITGDQIASLGWSMILLVLLGVTTTLAVGLLLGRKFGMSRAQAVLAGGSVAICGASAAIAISTVLPREKDSERFTLMVVVTVTVLSTIAMVLYPLVAKHLQLPPELAGMFIGGTIHDVAQVVGAGYMLDRQTGDVATLVKLFRVSLLVLVVLAISAAFRREREACDQAIDTNRSQPQGLVPWFLWLFIIAVAVNSAGLLPTVIQEEIATASSVCLVIGISALGVKTSFGALTQGGWRPMLLIVADTLWLAVFVLVSLYVMR